ncbi:hypothetical protein [Epilithonimonas arachidiradicis]|uniref:DUF4836 family protein n=1 Tax=Epilithonimonas arachidiradicis TaxID=1617282 RepID=A0A420DCD1_9FLAO|nr:hypothetical protein [Epilithonimonas arachidiradicis]RKE89535.1 hypothetical protein BXY58_0098 [Epilithonimonas arachidiradicis]GGG43233.1 hypothetical protein GCM10007332_00910 [Epilithonimonas arachidiradicis]
MKSSLQKVLFLFLLFCFSFAISQSRIQVPDNVLFYMEVNGKQLNGKVDWQKLNPILQELNKNSTEKPTWKDFSDVGIENDAKQYHYATFNDTVKTYTAHLILKDSKKFLNFLNTSAKKELEVTKKDKYSYVNLNNESFVAWNDKKAVMSLITYTKKIPNDFWDDKVADSAVVVVDSVAMDVDSVAIDSAYYEPEKPFDYKEEIKYLKDEIKYQREDIKEHQQEIARIQKDIKYLEKHHKYPEEKNTETAEPEEIASAKPTEEYDEEAEDLAYRKELDSIKAADFKILKSLAEMDFDRYFNSGEEIEVPKEMVAFQDQNSDVFAFLNYGEVFQNGIYKKMMSTYKLGGFIDNFYNSNTFYNLYFEKNKVRLISNYQHKNAEIQKNMAAVYKDKKNKKLTALINDKSIGYYAINIDGYKYFDLMYSFFENNSDDNSKYQKELELVLETVKIVLDEEAISKIAPGNGIFVLNELNTKKVEYTDYEYDENYNSKEIKKMKDVVVPDFTFAFATENENYWKRVFNVLTSSKELSEKFMRNGDIYFFKNDAKNSTYIDQLCFTAKDGIVYLTTSPANLAVKKQSVMAEKLAKDTAKFPVSGRMDMKRFLNGLEQEFKTTSDKKTMDLLRKNMGDIDFKSEPKKGSIETEINYTTPNSSENSLMYFFDFCRDIMKNMDSVKTVSL